MESSSHKEAGGVAEGEAEGEEALLWYHHRSYKPCQAKAQARHQRLHRQEEDIVGEAARAEVGHRGFPSAPLQVVDSSEAS